MRSSPIAPHDPASRDRPGSRAHGRAHGEVIGEFADGEATMVLTRSGQWGTAALTRAPAPGEPDATAARIASVHYHPQTGAIIDVWPAAGALPIGEAHLAAWTKGSGALLVDYAAHTHTSDYQYQQLAAAHNLVQRRGDIAEAVATLRALEPSTQHETVVSRHTVAAAIADYAEGTISAADLRLWAATVLVRHDIVSDLADDDALIRVLMRLEAHPADRDLRPRDLRALYEGLGLAAAPWYRHPLALTALAAAVYVLAAVAGGIVLPPFTMWMACALAGAHLGAFAVDWHRFGSAAAVAAGQRAALLSLPSALALLIADGLS